LLGGFAVTSGASDTLSAADGRVRETIPGQNRGVAYLTLGNASPQECPLLEVTSPAAARVELHQHSHLDGRMQMRRVEAFSLAPGSRQVMRPGGLHLMLLELARPLRRGDAVDFHFDFGACGDLSVTLPVVAVGED